MAKKKDQDIIEKSKFWKDMRQETIQTIWAIFSFLVVILSLLASFHKNDGANLAGPVGAFGFDLFTKLFGIGYFLIPISFALIGIALLQGVEKKFRLSKSIGTIIFFLSGLGLIDIVFDAFNQVDSGGVVGRLVASPIVRLMDVWAASIFLLALVIVSLLILFEARIGIDQLKFWNWFARKKQVERNRGKGDVKMDEDEEAKVDEALAEAEERDDARNKMREVKTVQDKKRGQKVVESDEDSFVPAVVMPQLKPFTPPPLSLLEKDRGKPETGDIKANANIIKRCLQTFGITVEMDDVSIGPSVTRYSLKPAEGVKLSRIVALNNDLSLALAAHPIRIEAPIPGKSLVGIEVPNTAKTTVGLATLLGSIDFQGSDKPLLVSLGKDIAGDAHFCNLGKAPHMLIAGATGSGKSVSIHAIITSLLYRNSPENLKFIMIDPKRVELTLYNKIPHLLTPVITDPKKAILALKWAAKEMGRRYDVLEKNAARDIDSYHKSVLAPAIAERSKGKEESSAPSLPETMPFIVIVIDELADIMQSYPRELESAIVRLAQMSRAVGIHLIISTQRPSVNVITGLIKANIPSRVALQVASQIDSRTILDQMGAEKLLGAGDMLYLGGDMSKPIRLQSAFISESEVKRVVKFLYDEYKDQIMNEINITVGTETNPDVPAGGAAPAFRAMGSTIDLDESSFDDGEEDDMYESAREAVISANKASTSYLQRKLGIGYSRAAKLMDMLEERGVIGPANGSKPRDVMGGVSSSNGSGGESGPAEPNI